MRLIQQTLTLLLVLAIAGCSHTSPTTHAPSPRRLDNGPDVVFTIDNHGGYSHAGRRISLKTDGGFVETAYTDVIGNEKATTGAYTLGAAHARLVLTRNGREQEALVRVDFQGAQYWVHEADRDGVTRTDQAYLRQISLRLEPR